MNRSIWIGWDRREGLACEVARYSMLSHMSKSIPIHSLVLSDMVAKGIYTRPHYRRGGRLIDELSIRYDYDGSISTEHANSRFLVKHLAGSGWAMFCDGDFLFRGDVCELFDNLDDAKAVYCVKHCYRPTEKVKMDGQLQTYYSRKNWSSLMLINCDHPANQFLTLGVINSWPGRDLHAFNWLADDDIGELSVEWNYLVGVTEWPTQPTPEDALAASASTGLAHICPKGIHFTLGTPDMPGYEDCEFSEEWKSCSLLVDLRRVD